MPSIHLKYICAEKQKHFLNEIQQIPRFEKFQKKSKQSKTKSSLCWCQWRPTNALNNIKLFQTRAIPAVNKLTCSDPVFISVSISHMQF